MLAKGKAGKIRAPRRGLNKDEFDFETIWDNLSAAFLAIHNRSASNLSFEQLFRNAYKLVLKKKQDVLYDRVVQLENSWLRDHVRPRILSQVTPTMTVEEQTTGTQSNERRIAGERFIKTVMEAFAAQRLSMGLITDVLMYMDRVNSQDQRRPSIFATSMALFRSQVLRVPLNKDTSFDVLSLVETVMLDMIKMERDGETIDRPLVRGCCYMLECLYESYSEDESTKLYLTSFEPQFLAASRHFYQDEGKALLAEADASTFCAHARRRLNEEVERCQQTISPITEPKIRQVVEQELISGYIRDVINMEGTGVKYMLDNDKIHDLGNVFELVARVDSKKTALKEAVQKRVIELGTEINKSATVISEAPPQPRTAPKAGTEGKPAPEKILSQQTQAAIAWVEQILQLKSRFDRVWVEAFHKDSVMEKTLELSFQEFINANDRSPEYLSLFFDEYLKRGGRDKTEAEVDALLDNGILLLQYLANRDLFETYYKKHMAKRLLMKKSISREMERQMLSKMKMKIGNQFTQKLEGLIRDTELSDDLSAKYKDYVNKLGDRDPDRIDLDCRVLTTTVWPFEALFRAENNEESRLECKFPPSVERIRQKFEKFYLDKHTGRKLTWMPSLGDADLRATFTNGGKTRRYEVNVSTYGMVILMLFNDLAPGESLTLDEIAAETNIPRHDLLRNLQSLSLVSKWRMLKKEPMSKEIKPTDRFSYNENFSSQFLKIKISAVAGGANRVENTEERKATQKRTDDERGHVIEAAIVRIMKARKTLPHSQLMSETLQQLSARFQPDVNMVKKKIEALIDREYLERGPDPSKPSYNYLA